MKDLALRDRKIYKYNNERRPKLVYRLRKMPNGNLKSLFKDNIHYNVRYSNNKPVKAVLLDDEFEKPIVEINIKYTKHTVIIDAIINYKYGDFYRLVDIKDCKEYVANRNNIHLYIMKTLNLGHKRTQITVHSKYNKRILDKSYLFESQIKSYNDLVCYSVYCEDLCSGTTKLFQIINPNTNLVLEEHIDNVKYRFSYNDDGLLCCIYSGIGDTFISYNTKGQIIEYRSYIDKKTYYYDNHDNLKYIYDSNGKMQLRFVHSDKYYIYSNDSNTYINKELYYI
jgi:hypothetical protein